MNDKVADNASIKQFIISVVKDEKPETVDALVKLVQQKYRLTEREATDLIVQLENEGKIRLTQKETSHLTLKDYVFSSRVTWFWVTVALGLATSIAVFAIPEDAYPIVYIRYGLGAIFVLWLPGFTLMKVLFPQKKEMDTIERTSLSLGLSLALVAIVALLLNYTPWGIRLAPIFLSLLALTMVFAVVAVVREHQTSITPTKA